MSERDELAQITHRAMLALADDAEVTPGIRARKAADAILAAGYRKPRTAITASELDALPVGSVVLDGSAPPCSFQKGLDDIWWAGSPYHHGKTATVLARGTAGVTVLHVGGER